jgi:sensor histidine kinase YesM
MIIQPLIENVILHANYEQKELKEILVKIKYEKDYFYLQVIDFGKGIKEKIELNSHKSYGTEIIKSRIKLYNGEEYQDSDFEMIPTNLILKTGNTVKIKLKEWK